MILISKTENFKIVQGIAAKTWPATYDGILSPEQFDYMFSIIYDLRTLQNQAKEKKHHFILATENEVPLGFACYELNYKKITAKIHKIYIMPEMQGKGIGKKLIDFITNDAKENNQVFLCLNVNRYNKAFYFYTKLGFEKVAEEDIEIGHGYLMEDFVMLKKINDF